MDHGYFGGGNLGAGFVFRWLWEIVVDVKFVEDFRYAKTRPTRCIDGLYVYVIEYYARPMVVYTFRHCVGCDKNIKVIILLLSSVAGVKVPANIFLFSCLNCGAIFETLKSVYSLAQVGGGIGKLGKDYYFAFRSLQPGFEYGLKSTLNDLMVSVPIFNRLSNSISFSSSVIKLFKFFFLIHSNYDQVA